MKPLIVLNAVGLSDRLLGENTPNLLNLAAGGQKTTIQTTFPAVTCSVQASILTGKQPCEHGIVANGWYFRDLSEVWLWRQSNHLIQAPKFWDIARKKKPNLKVAKLFWWYNMYSTADWSVTPRPSYMADGRKIPDIYTEPPELRNQLQNALGPFPLFRFWGPLADLTSSEWIGKCARKIFEDHHPDLTLIYLPHLDYNLQRLGPDNPAIGKDVQALDKLVGELVDFFLARDCDVAVLSEYAILPVSRPVHLNRVLRKAGYLRIHHNYTGELLDMGASRAFAVADHQVAHIYIKNPEDIPGVQALLQEVEGVTTILDREGQREWGLDHHRSGELVAMAEKDSWFTYYYWLEDHRAPDFARTVDIHKKPGYDPVELFFNPDLAFLKPRLLLKLLKKKLGFSTLMNVIPLKPELVRGSHGIVTTSPDPMPLLITSFQTPLPQPILATDLHKIFMEKLTAS